MDKEKNIKIRYLLFLLVGLLFGVLSTYLIVSKGKTVVTRNEVKDEFAPLYEAYDAIKRDYYKDVNDEDLINGAIDGMMKSLGDKHSMFFDKENKQNFVDELSGTYYGIGAEIKETSDNQVMINNVFDDSPADKAGLKSGDIFVSIDGKSCKGKSSSELASSLKSKSKDKAVIVINRKGKELTFNIVKDNVDFLSVSSKMLDNKIGYIAVAIFGQNTHQQFLKAINKLEDEGMKSLIIDLRGNTGGYLNVVTEMINIFVPKDTVIYQMRLRDVVNKYTAYSSDKKDYKVVILVDKGSASASEIMTSALQEQYKAVVVGKTTYGKGTVQDMLDLSNGTLIKYTTQEWLTSLGKSINDKGIEPDYDIELSEKFKNNPIMENDNQLNKAIELCK